MYSFTIEKKGKTIDKLCKTDLHVEQILCFWLITKNH